MLFELHRPLWRVLLYLVSIMVSSMAAVEAKPVAVPPWAKAVEDHLPKLTPEIVSEVDDLWMIMENHSGNFDTIPNPDAAYVQAARRFVALKEQASQAMVWQYLKESSSQGHPNTDQEQAAAQAQSSFRMRLLAGKLKLDPELACYFLPVLRAKMEYLENAIRSNRFDKFSNLDEMGGIQIYLYNQGEISDIMMFEHLIATAKKAGFFQKDEEFQQPLKEQMPTISATQNRMRLHARPFWQWPAEYLAAYGYLDKKSLSIPNYAFSESSVGIVGTSSRSQDTGQAIKEVGASRSIVSRWILGVLSLAAIAMLGLVFMRRK